MSHVLGLDAVGDDGDEEVTTKSVEREISVASISRHITISRIPTFTFFKATCTSYSPTNSVKALKASNQGAPSFFNIDFP